MRPHAVNLPASRLPAIRVVVVAIGALLAAGFAAIALRDRVPNAFHPHGYCYLWDPALIGLLVTSDTAIWLSYLAIGITLLRMVRKGGRAIPFRWMFVAFGAFIASCGTTHLMDVVTLYVTAFWLSAAIKGVTAVASVATAIALPPLVPRALRLLDDARLSAQRRDELEQLARAAAAGEAKFRALLESTPDAIVTVASDGRILLVNSEAEGLFGHTRDELVGRQVEILLPGSLRTAHEAHRREFNADSRRRPMGVGLDLVAVRKDGSAFPTEVSLSPFNSDDGPAVIVVVRDITERRKAEAARVRLLQEQAARAEAEAASRAKDELLAVVSHELRTPLNAIIGWTSLLRSKSLDEGTTGRALEVIDRNAQAQRQVVEDLLDVSSVMARKVRLTRQEVDLHRVLEAALDSARPSVEAKGLTVDVAIGAMLPHLYADPHRLQQIFWNLLSNAVKFTAPNGTIRVTAEGDASRVRIRVMDSGIGIAPSFLPHVFERFRQRDSSTTRAYGGLGLGLALVRELVELHGGTVAAESGGEGRGASFTVELPVSSAPAGVRSGDEPFGSAAHPVDLTGVRVLFVDDESDTRELASQVLRGAGAEVVMASSGDDALGELSHTLPDVLISDIAMPDIDGYRLMREVRERGLPVPAIALTALGREQDRERAMSAGYEMCVTKPLRPDDLIAAVAYFVRAHRRPA